MVPDVNVDSLATVVACQQPEKRVSKAVGCYLFTSWEIINKQYLVVTVASSSRCGSTAHLRRLLAEHHVNNKLFVHHLTITGFGSWHDACCAAAT